MPMELHSGHGGPWMLLRLIPGDSRSSFCWFPKLYFEFKANPPADVIYGHKFGSFSAGLGVAIDISIQILTKTIAVHIKTDRLMLALCLWHDPFKGYALLNGTRATR